MDAPFAGDEPQPDHNPKRSSASLPSAAGGQARSLHEIDPDRRPAAARVADATGHDRTSKLRHRATARGPRWTASRSRCPAGDASRHGLL